MVSGLTMSFGSVMFFTVLQSFPFLEEGLGVAGTYWVFAFWSAVTVVTAAKAVPHTKGLSRTQISRLGSIDWSID